MPTNSDFQSRLGELQAQHRALIERPNRPAAHFNGIYRRWTNPILTADHTPLFWRYDLDAKTNP
jgi:4-O-beta-D-mannosyl-D-glucose phosphorylase